ncbi:MAG: chemotaxis protein CheV [Phycisphaerae bacterium]
MAKMQQHNIMLEAGTNEYEILVFRLGDRRCGVNVAKVREVIEFQPLTRLPETHHAVLGVFQLRDQVLPLIDLGICLGQNQGSGSASGQIIVMEYNETRVAFRVDAVEYIHRIKASEVEPMPDVHGLQHSPVTFVARISGDLVLMIDFEKLVFDIAGIDPFAVGLGEIEACSIRGARRLLLAEDSVMIRTMIHNNLVKAGYKQVTTCADGQAAWDALLAGLVDGQGPSFDLMVTDIEMPRMDGLHLTKRIKEHPQLNHLPVVVFSSLISADNAKKCESVGADAQITKPELGKLVSVVDGLLEHLEVPAAV